MKLEDLGWNDAFQTALTRLQTDDPNLTPARVCASQREHYRLWNSEGEHEARLSGHLRHHAADGALPVVGDWVATRRTPHAEFATITHCLPRRSALQRKGSGRSAQVQVLAANIDLVLWVTSLNHDFNPRRIERALAMIWDCGAQPVLLLSKQDLCEDPEVPLQQAREVALGVPIHALSAHSGAGMEQLGEYLQPQRTLALLGSSGVGKSTLLNALLREARMRTEAIRAGDDRGRHTTTTRELFRLPGGALLIDSPGVRELGLWEADAGLTHAFDDVDALARACRFPDCGHRNEPGCEVHAAIARGELEASRYEAFLKLQRELAFEARRHDERARLEHRTQMRRVFKERARSLRALAKSRGV
jgi:ribosome biogenesis GTPase